MKNSKKQKQLEKLIKEGRQDDRESLIWFRSGRTVQSVDFQRIENNPNGTSPLSPFELEVKEKLASAPSPFDELARQEDEVALEHEEISLRAKMAHLIRGTKLSPRQKRCYELLYLDRLADKEVQKKLGISQSRLSHLKREIKDALIKSHGERRSRQPLLRRKGSRKLTLLQRRVLKLRGQGKTFDQIASELGIAKKNAYLIFKRVQKKYLPRDNG